MTNQTVQTVETVETTAVPIPTANTKTVTEEKKKGNFDSIQIASTIYRVAKTPVAKTTANGKAYTEVLLAQNVDFTDETNWITMFCWSNDNVEKHVAGTAMKLKERSLIEVKNYRIKANSWTYEGNSYTRMEAHVNSNRQLKFLALGQPKTEAAA